MKKVERNFIDNWKKIFIKEQVVSVRTLQPGNFYKIEIYKYADGTTKTLSGIKTAYIFLIGKFTNGGKKYFAALKLKNVDPLYFFNDIKLMLSPSPTTAKAIDDAYNEENSNSHDEFSSLLRKFPNDGRPLFEIIKRKRRIYDGNYREYVMDSVKSVKHIDVSSDFLKKVLKKKSKKSENIKEVKEKINTRKPEIEK